MKKPNPRFCRFALEKFAVAPEEAFFTDDVPRFVEAANEIGIHGILFGGAEKLTEAIRALGVK